MVPSVFIVLQCSTHLRKPFQSKVKVKKVKYVDLYSASSRSTSNARLLPSSHKLGLIFASQPNSQAFSEHCEITDTGWCITQYVCLLSQLSPGTHSSLTSGGRLRLSRPGCLVLRRGGLHVRRRSPTQALTGPSVE